MNLCTLNAAACLVLMSGFAEPQSSTSAVDLSEQGIRRLIANIEDGANADHLKFRVFLSRERGGIDKSQVLSLIEKELEKADVATERWFLLASVKAFAISRSRIGNVGVAEEYHKIFSHSAVLARFPETMGRIAGDFVAIASRTTTRRPPLPRQKVEAILEGLLPEWFALSELLTVEPSLYPLIEKYELSEVVDRCVDNVSQDTRSRFAFNYRAGGFYLNEMPVLGLSFLMRAKRMPQLKTLPDLRQRQFYEMLVRGCEQTEQLSQAIRFQQHSVAALKGSRALLAHLYERAGETQKRDAVLADAEKDTARRDDVLPTANLLVSLGMMERAIRLLGGFLTASPETDAHALRAILRLLELHEANGNRAACRKVLSQANFPAKDTRIPFECRVLMAQIQRAQERLGAGPGEEATPSNRKE